MIERDLDALAAETRFSGVVRIDGEDGTFVKAYGLAHRGHGIPNEPDTRFAIASGTKGMTALAVVSLVEEGTLELTTTARSLLGDDLPLVGDDVTVEHLLSHRSGIGDYFDEEAESDITTTSCPCRCTSSRRPSSTSPPSTGSRRSSRRASGSRTATAGYVVLALIAERASGTPFHELVVQRVCEPAGMRDTEFLRSDELPGRAALGYLSPDGPRTNVFHLPVRGSGDGGIYSTAADIRSLWKAFFAGEIVSEEWVREMVRPRSDPPDNSMRYGLGFWLHASTDTVILEGYDAGVSFRSLHDPHVGVTWTVIGNTADGAWALSRFLAERVWS